MPNLEVNLNVDLREALEKVVRFSPAVVKALQKAANDRAAKMQARYQTEMAAEYTSAWATGRAGKSIKPKVSKVTGQASSISVTFSIGQFREVDYITGMMGGHWQDFPVDPFIISARNKKYLRIPFPSPMARRFISDPNTGRMMGSHISARKPPEWGPAILVKAVLWGRRTGGFRRDVLREVSEQEGAAFVQDMQEVVSNAVSQMKTSKSKPSRRKL